MNYVESFLLLDTELKQIPCVLGAGVPTTSTEGVVGLFYMDTNTGTVYKCTAATANNYTWEVFGGTGIQSVEQTTTSTEDEGINVFTITLTDGTVTTFSVKNGSKGSDGIGADGKSAYAYAQDAGYTGTEAEFAEKLAEDVPEEIYVGDGDMPEGATIQIIMDGVNEEQALKDELKAYIDEEIANLVSDGKGVRY